MSDSSSWYAQRIAALRGQPAPQAPAQPQYTPPTQWSPQGQQMIAVQEVSRQGQPQPDDDGKLHFGDVMHLWKGGKGVKTETSNCPQCDSTRYFSRSNGASKRPAPHCFDCGYNGIWDQFGNSDEAYRG